MNTGQEHDEEMEMLLWDYIDGGCNATEEERVSQLIANDSTWKSKYNELLAFNTSLTGVAPEQPSMRFTKDVMDAIATTAIAPKTKSYINNYIVRSIAAFFLLVITVSLFVLYSGVNSSIPQLAIKNPLKIKLDWLSSGTVMNFIALTGILCLLLLADHFIRNKRTRAHFS